MKKECGYSPFCAQEGCELIAGLENQASQSGAKTREQAQNVNALQEPGGIWIRSKWKITAKNAVERAPQFGCVQIPEVEKTAKRLTQEKDRRRELV